MDHFDIGYYILATTIGLVIGGLVLHSNLEYYKARATPLPTAFISVVSVLLTVVVLIKGWMLLGYLVGGLLGYGLPSVLFIHWWEKNKPPPDSDFDPTVIANDPVDLAKKIDEILDKSRRKGR